MALGNTLKLEEGEEKSESPFWRDEGLTRRINEDTLRCITHPQKRAFLVAFSKCAIVLDGMEAAGVCRKTTELWRQNDPEFARMFELAKEDAADRLEAHAMWRATQAKKPSDIVLFFLLKGMRPHKYRDNISISGHDGGPLFRMVAGVTPAKVCGLEDTKPARLKPSEAKALLESAKQDA